ncbi:unnamed protein product [Chondrus crispus]|uniref:Uncharacterized protein n=1 Tax=Chondrus crispus TaxID=2769 RepID=R7QCR6_CHOCR|nr:unnamed protein product [Chondrus crispus]CDF36302.1 unnamed protein product [Chondrus crispus]|eukprot:XP_005716121.1 unnamed protein product [Chondrus crispus]
MIRPLTDLSSNNLFTIPKTFPCLGKSEILHSNQATPSFTAFVPCRGMTLLRLSSPSHAVFVKSLDARRRPAQSAEPLKGSNILSNHSELKTTINTTLVSIAQDGLNTNNLPQKKKSLISPPLVRFRVTRLTPIYQT